MLPFVVISIVILSVILLLHYQRHFKFRLRCTNPESTRRFSATDMESSGSGHETGWSSGFMKRKSSTRPRVSTIDTVTDFLKDAKSYRCMFTSSTDQEFDFFPITYFFYILFLIIVCAIIIIRCIMCNTYIQLHVQYVSYPFDASLPSDHTLRMTHITDWILVYCILILSLWESLFSFYRFYLTYHTTKSLSSQPHPLKVFLLFAVYILVYTAFYIAFVHYNYWFFPFIIVIHFIFNTFCTFQFAAILIKTYQSFISMESNQQNIMLNQHILYSVYFMRKTSFICTVVQSVYLSAFAMCYTVDIVCYIPVLWTISAVVFTLNFVRNREFLIAAMYKHNQLCCCCICLHQASSQLSGRSRNHGSKSKSKSHRKCSADRKRILSGNDTTKRSMDAPAPTKEKPNIRTTDERFMMRDLKINVSGDELMTPTTPNRPVSSPSVPSTIARESIVPLPISRHPRIQTSQSAFDLKPRLALKSKALDLLGLHPPLQPTLQPFRISVDRLQINNDSAGEEEEEEDGEFEATMINRPTPQPTPQQTPVSTQGGLDVSQAQYSINIPTPVREAADVTFDIVVEEEEMKVDAAPVAPNEMNLDQLNLNEVVRSLNLLVNHGFCSKQTVNNVKEISRYIHKRQHY